MLPRPERSLADALAGAPRAFREQAQKGFRVLAGIGREHHGEIVRSVIRTLESRQPHFEELEKSLSLSKDDLSGLVAAAMIAVPLLAERGTAEEFTSAAVKVGLLPAELTQEIVPFAQSVISERSGLGRTIRRTAMSSQVLPYLAEVEIVVDLRIDFENQEVHEAVPLAMFHIDTDANGQEIWFQASKPQLERLRSDIEAAIKRMENAEAWARRGPPS